MLDYSFELAKRRLRPQEVDQLQTELKQYVVNTGQLVQFAYRGADLMAVGKTAEALALAQKIVREHPENALAQMRFSQMLTAAGAGQAALAAAKQAVEDDPPSARAWLILAYAYEHDSFGRLRTGDWNPGEAEKALRKSIELDASDTESKSELAILLEHDAAGERYGKSARLAEAVTLYQQILAKSPNPNLTRNLVITLLHLGRYPEAQQELQKAGQLPMLADLGIALTALTDGTERAILSSRDQFADNAVQAQVLARAGMILYQVRRYENGVELLRRAQRLNSDPEAQKALQLYTATKPYEKLLQPETTPSAPVQHFLLLAAKPMSTRQQLSALISTHTSSEGWQARLEDTRARLGLLRANLGLLGGNSESLSDLVISHSKVEVAEDHNADSSVYSPSMPTVQTGNLVVQHVSKTGFSRREKPAALVTVTSTLNLGLLTFFVAQEDGHWKLLASGDGLEDIGRLALNALAKNDLPTAQAWLDLVKDNALPLSPQDDKGPAIRYLWAGTAPETRNAIFAKAAAASLLGTYSGSHEAAVLLKQIAEHPVPYMERDDLTFALCETLRQGKEWKQLRTAAEPLLKSRSYGESAIRFIGEALINLQDWAGLAKAAEARLATSPKDHSALQFAAIAAMARHDFPLATQYVKNAKSVLYGSYLSDDLLEQWNGILSGKVPDEVVDSPANGNIFSVLSRGSAYAYTFALAQLRNGRSEDCHKSLLLALNLDQTDPSALAWLVEGELLKQYALEQAAASAMEHARAKGGWDRLAFAPLLLQP